MGKKIAKVLVASLITVGLGVSSCGTKEPVSDVSPNSVTQSAPAAEFLEVDQSSQLAHFTPSELSEIGFVNNSTKAETVAEFKVSNEYVLVFIRCIGSGLLKIEIENQGIFPLPCENATEMVSINQFNVSGVIDTAVSITPQGDLKWAASVAQSPSIDPEYIGRVEQEYLEFLELQPE